MLSSEERAARVAARAAGRAARAAAVEERAVARAKRELVEAKRSATERVARAAAKSDATAMDEAGQKFLATLARGFSATASAKAAGLALSTVYQRRSMSAKFAAEWALAEDMSADRLEDEMFRRGVTGVEEPVFQGGKLVGTKRVYSDFLLNKKVEAARPEKFRDRRVQHVGAGGGPIQVQHEARARLTDRLARLAGDPVDLTIGADGVARVVEG